MKLTYLVFIIALISGQFSLSQQVKVPSKLNTKFLLEQKHQLTNQMDELDPFDPNIEEKLEQIDQDYFAQTGKEPILEEAFTNKIFGLFSRNCVRKDCKVWLQIVKSTQRAYLYIDGTHQATWRVSTGTWGHGTPNFDTHPNGRIYDAYTSTKYPGGNYNGLGNMPYAVFISGGFAVHGTGVNNWAKLGSKASHGCIRLHPDQAYYFNRLVRKHGIKTVWITVQD